MVEFAASAPTRVGIGKSAHNDCEIRHTNNDTRMTNDEQRSMTEKIKNFRDLNIWKLGMEIAADIYKETKQFPQQELYGLSSQMRRAAVSIPSNIAEGFARKYNKEYRQFLYIGLGSCAELQTHIEIAYSQGYLSEEIRAALSEKIDHISRMTMSLIKCLN